MSSSESSSTVLVNGLLNGSVVVILYQPCGAGTDDDHLVHFDFLLQRSKALYVRVGSWRLLECAYSTWSLIQIHFLIDSLS